jgi:hypothetical protein
MASSLHTGICDGAAICCRKARFRSKRLKGIDGIEFGFNFLKRSCRIRHHEVGTRPEFFNHLVAPAFAPSLFSGRAIKFFIYLTISLPDKNSIIE